MTRAAALLAAGLVAAAPVSAQMTVETVEGWTFTFAGNVNAFYVFEREARSGQVSLPGAAVGVGRQGSSVRSGYLPAFAVLSARRTEGGTTVGVHFGFAPQIHTSSSGDTASAGARIDMRQVYLTASGAWGQILAGREIGLFARQNLLNDMSLFGAGATGGNFGNPAATTLGRSGFGYIYPGFHSQLTYTSPAGQALQLSVGVFDPLPNNGFDELVLPRIESEVTYSRGATLAWIAALVQHGTDTAIDRGATAWGLSGGVRIRAGGFGLTSGGYSGLGIGTTRLFADARGSDPLLADLRRSHGWLAQLTWTRPGQPLTLGASYGASRLESGDSEPRFELTNQSATAGAYVQLTPSLKLVGEATRAWSSDDVDGTRANQSLAGALGLMLFF